MKKLVVGIQTFLFIVFLSSCTNQNKSTEDHSANTQTMQPADTTENSNQSAQSETAKPANGTQSSGERQNVELTGSQIIENISNKLNDKLNLTEQQLKDINEVLNKKFIETGGDVNGKYPLEIAKNMGRELRQKSASSISAVLNQDQKERFEKFMQK